MRSIYRVSIAAACLIMAARVATADVSDFDMASDKQLEQTRGAGTITVRFLHRISGAYIESVERTTQPIPALPLPANVLTGVLNVGPGKEHNGCAAATETLESDLSKAESEGKVRDLLNGAAKKLQDAGCSEAISKEEVAALEKQHTAEIVVVLSEGEEVTIKLSRMAADKTSLEWTVTLKTKPRGQWLTTYGLSVLPKRDESFSARPTGNANEYAITRDEDRSGELNFLPSVYFAWLPEKWSGRDLVPGLTAGAGVGDHVWAVFLGPSVLYNWNLEISAGASVFQVKRLAGKYREGQIVHENLSADQLQRQTYWPAWYAAATFRFGDNPFKPKSTQGAADTKTTKNEGTAKSPSK